MAAIRSAEVSFRSVQVYSAPEERSSQKAGKYMFFQVASPVSYLEKGETKEALNVFGVMCFHDNPNYDRLKKMMLQKGDYVTLTCNIIVKSKQLGNTSVDQNWYYLKDIDFSLSKADREFLMSKEKKKMGLDQFRQ